MQAVKVKTEDLLVFRKDDISYVGKLSELNEITTDMVISTLENVPESEFTM